MHLPIEIVVVFAVFLMGSWFLLGDKSTFWEKMWIIIFVIGLYVGYRMVFHGPSLQELISPYVH